MEASLAQTFTPDATDRAAAVGEDNLTWYSLTPFPLVQTLAVRFQQETGIKVELLRLGGEAVLRRFMEEYQAGLRDMVRTPGLGRGGEVFPPRCATRIDAMTIAVHPVAKRELPLQRWRSLSPMNGKGQALYSGH